LRRVKCWPLAAVAALVLAPATLGSARIDARAFLVQSGTTGDVLRARNSERRLPIASITKLMTALVTLEHARLDDVVTVSGAAVGAGGSTIRLRAGERLTVRELLEAALIQSANDSADALAAYVGDGSEERFVAMMNARARELGLTRTHFVRPDGLDAPGHVSSARDVTLLARVLMHKPAFRRIVRQPTAAIAGGRVLHTWNDLLTSFPGVIGVKTGHTSLAGWSEVAAARRGPLTIYATILGSPSRSERNSDLARLLAWGFSRYGSVDVIRRGRVYGEAQAGYGRSALALVPARPATAVVRLDRPLVERVEAAAAVSLPVKEGTTLGRVRVFQGRRLIAASPLVAARSISRPGLFGRVGWYTGRTVHHVWSWITP
jgi:D-alanyl-D-alanine carboxypeptidase (penicillin-binding protein 5/6)